MKLSIIISAYNVESHIKRTLNSIISQTTKQFELIVVNDGSTDGTYDQIKEILESLQEVDCKIITKENGGVSSARNRGLKEATGEYVMFLDGDDYITENLVERIYGELESRNVVVDAVCWGYSTVDEYGTILKNYFDDFEHINIDITGIIALKNIFICRTMWICIGSAAFRKKLLNENELEYTEGCFSGEDQEFTIRVLSRVKNIVFIDDILLFYVQREGSASNSLNIRKFDVIYAINRACFYLNKSNK
jgi:glycosyltransferase involved in cell wall biosynthesis